MVCLHQLGERAEALRVYARCRDVLGPYDDPTALDLAANGVSFATVTLNKLRLSYDNLDLYQQYGEHGGLHEVSVFNDASAVPEPGFAVGVWPIGVVRCTDARVFMMAGARKHRSGGRR